MKEYDYERVARQHLTWGIVMRMLGYIVLATPPTLIFLWLAVMSRSAAALLLTLVVPFIFFLWEKSIRRFRRKHGLSVYKNVSADLEQMAIDERVAKEHKAYINNGIVKESFGDKKDIGYWFGLLEKGAITQVEYEAKKKELL